MCLRSCRRCSQARTRRHRAAFTGVRRPGSAALSLPPRAINPSRRSKATVAIHPSCHAQVFWRAGEAHKDGRYAEDFGRTRAIALVGKARQHHRVARLPAHVARLHHGREARPPRPVTISSPPPRPASCCFQHRGTGRPPFGDGRPRDRRGVGVAIEKDRSQRQERAEVAEIQQRLDTLTPREREVLEHVIAGQLNKQIASDLGTGEHTIKVHRARVMEKMGVVSLADLVRAAERLGLGKSGSSAA